jgi:hypothetical protein
MGDLVWGLYGNFGNIKGRNFLIHWGHQENQHFPSISLEIVIWNMELELWDLDNQINIWE